MRDILYETDYMYRRTSSGACTLVGTYVRRPSTCYDRPSTRYVCSPSTRYDDMFIYQRSFKCDPFRVGERCFLSVRTYERMTSEESGYPGDGGWRDVQVRCAASSFFDKHDVDRRLAGHHQGDYAPHNA